MEYVNKIILYDSPTKRIDKAFEGMTSVVLHEYRSKQFNEEVIPAINESKLLHKKSTESLNNFLTLNSFQQTFYEYHSFRDGDKVVIECIKLVLWPQLSTIYCDFFVYQYKFDSNVIDGNPVLGYAADIITTVAGTLLGFVTYGWGFTLAGVGFTNTVNRIRVDKDVMSELLIKVKNEFEAATV